MATRSIGPSADPYRWSPHPSWIVSGPNSQILGATTLSIMTSSTTINKTRHSVYNKFITVTECCYAECDYDEYRYANVAKNNFFILSIAMLSIVMLSIIILSIVMLSIVMLNFILLSVMAPKY